jgi:Flp pilus assembly protein TadG
MTHRRERGSASVELVVAAPLILLLIMMVVQFAMWAHATHVAQAAANSGVQTARAYHSSADDGRTQAISVLDQLAGTVLTGARVDARRDSATATATVTVTGDAVAVLPGLRLPVHVSVTAPRELVPGTP